MRETFSSTFPIRQTFSSLTTKVKDTKEEEEDTIIKVDTTTEEEEEEGAGN